jgi:hypothetical protein
VPARAEGLREWAAKTLGRICAKQLEQFVNQELGGAGLDSIEGRIFHFLITNLAHNLKDVTNASYGEATVKPTLAWLLSPAFEEYCRPLGLDARAILEKLEAIMRQNRSTALEWRREAIRRRLEQFEGRESGVGGPGSGRW